MRASPARGRTRPGGASARRGWIRVMHVDIACSLAVYTLATVAFYLLGAGVLHGRAWCRPRAT